MQIDPERSSALADMYAGRTMLKSKVLHVSESAFLGEYKYKMCCALETLRILAPEAFPSHQPFQLFLVGMSWKRVKKYYKQLAYTCEINL